MEELKQAGWWMDSSLRKYSIICDHKRSCNIFNKFLYKDNSKFFKVQDIMVSHHPPIGAAHAESEHFIYEITSKVRTKFLGNSVDVYPIGRTRLTLKKAGVELELVPPSKVNNLIFGRTWVDSPGEMVVTNLTTGDKVVLYFQPCGWFGPEDKVSNMKIENQRIVKFTCKMRNMLKF